MAFTQRITWVCKILLSWYVSQLSIFDWYYDFDAIDTHTYVLLIPLLMLIINTMHTHVYLSNNGLDPTYMRA